MRASCAPASTARCRSARCRRSDRGAVRAVVHQLRMTAEREIASRRVGEFVMGELRKLDHVGYVRFASVYRSFEDVADFREELDRLERDLPGEGQLPLLGGEDRGKGQAPMNSCACCYRSTLLAGRACRASRAAGDASDTSGRSRSGAGGEDRSKPRWPASTSCGGDGNRLRPAAAQRTAVSSGISAMARSTWARAAPGRAKAMRSSCWSWTWVPAAGPASEIRTHAPAHRR
jgi:hypothetical protein